MMQFNNVAQFVANNINQHGFVLNNNLTAVEPVLVDHIYDSHGSTGPLVLVGFLAGEPIYRTTHTVAHRNNAFFKLKNLFAKYFFFCRHGRKRTRGLSNLLATIVPKYLDTGMRSHAIGYQHSSSGTIFFQNLFINWPSDKRFFKLRGRR
jgi:hypothetical protein